MIRGHIDFVSRSRVEGWIACPRLPLTGARVLAFVDETCIGGGTVNLFRQDLLDAGFGDGVVGFGFPIAPEPWHDTRVLDVRLEGGSTILKQSRACLVPREAVGEDRRRQGRDPASLAWMLARGWLSQAHFDALRVLGEFGVHSQALAFRSPPDQVTARCDEAALAAADLVEMHMLQPAELEIRDTLTPGDLSGIRRELRNAFPHVPPVIGLWAAREHVIDVVEGAHRPGAQALAGGGVEYVFGGRHLMMLDLDGDFSFARDGEAGGFSAFVPCRP
ncbi:hypothetical protein GCM10011390_17310 [Aureimonas endophytica]|uniref:Uncharacterized protein n=1 Tax=Aureimonas endophytica TaxID=2027858 RepID=A0A917E2M9_9HYPH|nr:hypothetical protein [Aureimonas endophytica]GGD99067.1 hypothetical protein GCM10011390_17310 [Aureimonas endophytica]